MDATRVSLLLPNYNNERVLGTVLDRLAANTTHADTELVIVDDGSTDGSVDIITRWRDSGAFGGEVRLIEQPNGGAIAALNTALNAASGEVCVQIDSDASVETHGWVERMLELLLLDERVGVVTAKVVMDSGSLHTCGVNVIGPAGVHDRPSRVLEPVGRRRWHHRVERLREGTGGAAEERVAEVDASCGCCMMYRREDALAVGGYDTGYAPVWFDDVDLSLSIRKLGRKNFYLPDVRLVHYIESRQAPVAGRDHQRRDLVRELPRRAAQRLPARVRDRMESGLGVDIGGHFTRPQLARLKHHYRYWRDKWGFDLRNPDMAAVERRWGGTEVCWASDPERREAGEEIVRNLERARAST
jgi:glycosyltransferase involved in cell wall biosynthesis